MYSDSKRAREKERERERREREICDRETEIERQ
jgi:hypothetical protein